MAATCKTELLAVFDKDYAKLTILISGIESAAALAKDDEDTSIRDVIGHRAHWMDLFLGWYHDGQAGKTVTFPAPGYKWNELKRYNAALRAAQTRLRGFLEMSNEGDLYGGPMKGANNAWTPGRWAEAAGPSHFRSAAKYIRARLRVM